MMATRWSAASRRSAFQKAFSCDVVGRDGVAVVVPLHAGVAVGAEAAEEPVVGDAELLHRVVELAAPVLAQPVLAVGGEVLELGHQDLAHLTGGAGDQGDAAAHGDVLRHRRAVLDRLVVGVGVDQEQALVGYGSHGSSLGRPPDRSGGTGGRGRASRRRRARQAASQRTASCSTGVGLAGRPAAATGDAQHVPLARSASVGRASRADGDVAAELLTYLPDQRRLRRLPRLDLAAGELPPAGGLGGRRTAARQDPPGAHDRGADDDLTGRRPWHD